MQQAIMFGILITLLNKGKVTTNELSYKYEISKRTVQRYISAMCVAQIPISTYRGRNGGITLDKNYVLEKVYLTKAELKRLNDCFFNMLKLFDDNISRSLKDKLCINILSDTGFLNEK